MAKGQEIEELYISLGLNINDLKLGFDTAGKTVNQAITKLNNQNKKIQLKTDVDLSKLTGVGSELDKIKLKYEAINKQLDIQRQKEAILQAQYQRSVKDHGLGHGITQRAEMNLLYQQKNIAGLEAQLRTLGNSLNAIPPKSNRAFSSISKGAGMARTGIGKLTEGYTLLNAKLAAFMAVAGTGAGLFNITKDAMMAGNNLYKLQSRLNMTTGEAAELSRVFSLAGSDINSLTPFIARIDKQLLSAGASGNATSKALQKFGVSITDESGNLLQINEQLEQLAKGYRNAANAGEVEAFTAEVLGAKGAALIPVLEEYNDLMAISKSVKTTGLLNPSEAHETYLEWQKMEMEMGQLKMALGAALLPVSRELLPEITEMFVSWIKLISDNKEEIKLMGEILIDVMHEAGKAIDLVASGLDAIGVNAKNTGEILRDIKAEFDAGYGMALLAYAGNPTMIPLVGATLRTFDDVKEQRSKNDDAERSDKAEKEYYADIEKRTKARQKEVAQIKAQEQAEKNRLEDVAKASREMQESIYGLTHTELETQLHSIDKAMEKYKEAWVSEVELAKATEAQKAKVIKQFNDDVARSIDSVWKSAFQNRMDEIDREKEAWEKKGLDEVKATKWAEEQKRQLQQETALHMFKENYKYLKLYRKAMAGGGSMEEKQANAMQAIVEQLRKDANLPADAWTSREEIAGFEQVFKNAKENIIPIYDKMPTRFILKGTDAVPMFAPDYNEEVMSKLGNTQAPAPSVAPQENINYNLNVDVHGLEDVSHEVADTAAKKILDMLPQNSNVNISYGGG
ncbi:hypothetical protein [Anaerovibrio lipolyticus]|uniref:hypothetical protein n=1 Tax=Anaerovibrio lipolyticus TaxID=82374 RepID=UPI0026F0756B|nr:hypothetical protein [Anaerovibrio lipolyticus]MBE6105307.1 hypothetical protein [Anaerovibrio lipolyticus]